MKKWILLSFLFVSEAFAGNSMSEIAKRCGPLSPAEQPLYSGEFKWDYDIPGMLLKFVEIYQSPKRLPRRAYWDQSKNILKLPYLEDRGGDIEITESFIQSVVRHIEKAFELKYVDAVFFPDMGHSHLLIPNKLMKDKYNHYPVSDMTGMYRDLFKDDRIQILYHTAEQLKTLDDNGAVLPDPKIQWRYKTRNIVGFNSPSTNLRILQNPSSKANTVSEVPGHYWWGGGFNLSAQKEGCFEFQAQGRTMYFDLSMFDLEPDPEQGGWGQGAY